MGHVFVSAGRFDSRCMFSLDRFPQADVPENGTSSKMGPLRPEKALSTA
jgi:hypothetical protein